MSESLRPHGLQHARLPCPSLSLRVFPSSCPLSWWWHSTISSSVALFCPQSFSASGSFPVSQLFTSSGPNYWSFSFSISPSNECSGLISFRTGLISLQSKGLSRVFSSTTVWRHQFFSVQPPLWSNPTSINDYWKNHSFGYMDLCWQSDVSAF